MRGVRIGGVLGAVNADGYFAGGGAEFLIQSPVRAYPHVVLSDPHLWFIKFVKNNNSFLFAKNTLTEVRKPLPGAWSIPNSSRTNVIT